MNLMCANTQRMISNQYSSKESYQNTQPWFLNLKELDSRLQYLARELFKLCKIFASY